MEHLKNLYSGDRLILVSLDLSNPYHKDISKAFSIGDVFLFNHYINDINRIELTHLKSGKHYWIEEDAFYECFNTPQLIRNGKIDKIYNE